MNDPVDLYTDRSRRALHVAQEKAIELGHDYIGTDHLLYGLSQLQGSVAEVALRNLNITHAAISDAILALKRSSPNTIMPPLPYTPPVVQVLRNARKVSDVCNHKYIGTEHILIALTYDKACVAMKILINLGATPEAVRSEALDLLGITSDPLEPPKAATMQVNGFQIREAIKHWTLKREMAVKVFNDAGFTFDGENKTHPVEAAEAVRNSDEAVARLETFQQQFNSSISVEFNGKPIKLSQAVKMIAGVGRLENLWKTYAGKGLSGTDHHRGYGEALAVVRKADEVHAKRVMPLADCVAKAAQFAKQQAALRALISSANGTQIAVPEDLMDLFA